MKILLLLVFPILISCITIKSESALFAQYSKYFSETNKENIKKIHFKYFSRDLLGSESIDDPEVIDQLLFKSYMKAPYNYFEIIKIDKGCLTINGYDESNEPVAFNLEYVLLNNRWLINNIHILFLDDKSKFSKVAKCPRDYKTDI